MSNGSKFTKPKDDLYTSVLLQFTEKTRVSEVAQDNYAEFRANGATNDQLSVSISPHSGKFLV